VISGGVCGVGAVTGTEKATALRLPFFLCQDEKETGQDGWCEVGGGVGKRREHGEGFSTLLWTWTATAGIAVASRSLACPLATGGGGASPWGVLEWEVGSE
jgi:hypothetical protein